MAVALATVLPADKTFAGIPAGENLASIVHFYPNSDYLYKRIPSVDVPDGFFTLREGIWFTFVIEDFEVVTEDVNFHIEIPVKVGMLLNLLHDRLTDPDAQMQFKDEVLVGDILIPRGLH